MTKSISVAVELLDQLAGMELDTTERSIKIQDELRAILAQPAEAEGVEVPVVATLLIDEVFHGSNGPETGDWDIEHNSGVTEKLTQQFTGEAFDLVRQVDHLAALSAVTAERDRLRDAAGKAIAWLDAEQNESGVGINRRIKLCRDAENALRAAMAAKEA